MAANKPRWKPSDELTSRGRTQAMTAWAAELGCPVQTILGRLKRGWTVDRAVSEKPGNSGGSNRGKKAPAEILTPDELQRILEQCSDGATGVRNRALIVVGWRTGLRISEALDLRPSDLDATQHTVRVLHGKGDKARTVGLDTRAWSVVANWIEARGRLAIEQDAATLFCTLHGGRLDDRYVRELMPRLAKAAGVAKRVHYHGLRHTMAFELACENVPIHVIQKQLGHSDVAITSRYLNHVNPAEIIRAMRSRSWGPATPAAGHSESVHPAPGWLDRLRSDIGERLFLFHDARTSQDAFRAIVLLVD